MSRVVSFFVAVAVAAACGGGGGGGAPVRNTGNVSGALLVSPGSGGGGSVLEQEPNDSPAQAQVLGNIADGVRFDISGRVANHAADPFDGFRFETAGGRVEVTLTGNDTAFDIDAFVYDYGSQQVIGRLQGTTYPERDTFTVTGPFAVVTTGVPGGADRSDAYALRVEGVAGFQSATAPGLPFDDIAARWLGAHLPMVAGEIVVLRDGASLVRSLPAGFDVVREHGDMQVLRVHEAMRTAPSALVGLTHSAELETARGALRLAEEPSVRAASPNYLYSTSVDPNDPLFAIQWHLPQMRIPQAWDLTRGRADVTVAVVDTGIASRHQDFDHGRFVPGFDFISDANRAIDGDGIDPNPEDPGDGQGTGQPSSFHGTHVAGTIGASTNNGEGIAGVDQACKLMILRALGRGGSGSLEDIAQSIRFAAGLPNASNTVPARRADIINMSLGSAANSPVLEATCRDARNAGVLLVAAAGNDGRTTPTLRNFPASYDSVLSVGATRFDRTLASYSNRADTMDVVAPGGDVTVDQNGDNQPDGVLSCMADDSGRLVYKFSQGTSMATPHVAGVAALCKAAQMSLTADDLTRILTEETDDLGAPGRDAIFANGLVNAEKAVRRAAGGAPGAPSLVADVTSVDLTQQDRAIVGLRNGGNPAIQVVVAPPAVRYVQGGNGWLAVALEAPDASITATRLVLHADRTGLPDGTHVAEVELAASANNQPLTPVRIQVLLRVGAQPDVPDTIWILLVHPETFATAAQASTNQAAGFRYLLENAAPGRYLLVAGTDRDNDDFIGEADDLFGVWRDQENVELVEVAAGQTISNRDFPVAPQTVGFGAAPQAYRLLPR